MAKSKRKSRKSSSRRQTESAHMTPIIYVGNIPPRRKRKVVIESLVEADDHSID